MKTFKDLQIGDKVYLGFFSQVIGQKRIFGRSMPVQFSMTTSPMKSENI